MGDRPDRPAFEEGEDLPAEIDLVDRQGSRLPATSVARIDFRRDRLERSITRNDGFCVLALSDRRQH